MRSIFPRSLPLWLLTTVLAAADWPTASGPDLTGVAPLPADVDLVDRLEDIRLLWRSERRIPTSYGTDARKAQAKRTDGRDVGSGYSAPVVYAGRVYLAYHRPGGRVHDAEVAAKSLENGGWGRSVWTVEADDVVLCLDAETGRVVWRKVLAREGINQEGAFNKGGGHYLVWIEGERLVTYTSGGRLDCLATVDGRRHWRSGADTRALSLDMARQRGLETRDLIYFNRMLGQCPAVADGMVVMSDHREDGHWIAGLGGNGLTGLDLETGASRWYVPGIGSSATIWRRADGDRALVFHRDADDDRIVSCVAVADGRILWQEKGYAGIGCCSRIFGDRLLVNREEGIACLRLADAGPTETWTAPGKVSHGNTVLVDGFFYNIDMGKGFVLRSLAADTGKVVQEEKAWNPEYMGMVATGDLLLAPERKGVHVLRLGGGGRFEHLGLLECPIATCTQVAVADGVLFVRGRTRILAYDLRKP